MPDIKDQMIEEQQDRRERMHQAVDDIEAAMQAQNMVHVVKNPFMEMLTFHSHAEYCDKSL